MKADEPMPFPEHLKLRSQPCVGEWVDLRRTAFFEMGADAGLERW